ncbi:hypothetical protein [Streptomyces cavourensis]|uniref:hypothetical protein n=1 Tax=Streptomyces cavourensis TaxID=67258 RepID=UPI0020CA1F44|nr:hypothetical protein [Streptomyces cavourensis]
MADGEQPRNAGSRNVSDAPDAREPQDVTGDVTDAQESDAARRRRRAQFLRELHEAKQLRDRVQPRRARAARMRQQMRMRTFRW